VQLLVNIKPNVTLPLVGRLSYRTLIGRKAATSHITTSVLAFSDADRWVFNLLRYELQHTLIRI